MIPAGNRSRLFELRRDRVAALRSAELLERKREVLLRELARRIGERDALRAAIEPRYTTAHALLRVARVEAGTHAIAAAGLAQSVHCRIEKHTTAVMGVPLVGLEASCEPFVARYGTAGTSESMDVAGAAFAALVPDLIRLAQDEQAVVRLRLALRKATRLLNSLQKLVIPQIEAGIRAIVEGLEEEERDEAVRRRMRHTHA